MMKRAIKGLDDVVAQQVKDQPMKLVREVVTKSVWDDTVVSKPDMIDAGGSTLVLGGSE